MKTASLLQPLPGSVVGPWCPELDEASGGASFLSVGGYRPNNFHGSFVNVVVSNASSFVGPALSRSSSTPDAVQQVGEELHGEEASINAALRRIKHRLETTMALAQPQAGCAPRLNHQDPLFRIISDEVGALLAESPERQAPAPPAVTSLLENISSSLMSGAGSELTKTGASSSETALERLAAADVPPSRSASPSRETHKRAYVSALTGALLFQQFERNLRGGIEVAEMQNRVDLIQKFHVSSIIAERRERERVTLRLQQWQRSAMQGMRESSAQFSGSLEQLESRHRGALEHTSTLNQSLQDAIAERFRVVLSRETALSLRELSAEESSRRLEIVTHQLEATVELKYRGESLRMRSLMQMEADGKHEGGSEAVANDDNADEDDDTERQEQVSRVLALLESLDEDISKLSSADVHPVVQPFTRFVFVDGDRGEGLSGEVRAAFDRVDKASQCMPHDADISGRALDSKKDNDNIAEGLAPRITRTTSTLKKRPSQRDGHSPSSPSSAPASAGQKGVHLSTAHTRKEATVEYSAPTPTHHHTSGGAHTKPDHLRQLWDDVMAQCKETFPMPDGIAIHDVGTMPADLGLVDAKKDSMRRQSQQRPAGSANTQPTASAAKPTTRSKKSSSLGRDGAEDQAQQPTATVDDRHIVAHRPWRRGWSPPALPIKAKSTSLTAKREPTPKLKEGPSAVKASAARRSPQPSGTSNHLGMQAVVHKRSDSEKEAAPTRHSTRTDEVRALPPPPDPSPTSASHHGDDDPMLSEAPPASSAGSADAFFSHGESTPHSATASPQPSPTSQSRSRRRATHVCDEGETNDELVVHDIIHYSPSPAAVEGKHTADAGALSADPVERPIEFVSASGRSSKTWRTPTAAPSVPRASVEACVVEHTLINRHSTPAGSTGISDASCVRFAEHVEIHSFHPQTAITEPTVGERPLRSHKIHETKRHLRSPHRPGMGFIGNVRSLEAPKPLAVDERHATTSGGAASAPQSWDGEDDVGVLEDQVGFFLADDDTDSAAQCVLPAWQPGTSGEGSVVRDVVEYVLHQRSLMAAAFREAKPPLSCVFGWLLKYDAPVSGGCGSWQRRYAFLSRSGVMKFVCHAPSGAESLTSWDAANRSPSGASSASWCSTSIGAAPIGGAASAAMTWELSFRAEDIIRVVPTEDAETSPRDGFGRTTSALLSPQLPMEFAKLTKNGLVVEVAHHSGPRLSDVAVKRIRFCCFSQNDRRTWMQHLSAYRDMVRSNAMNGNVPPSLSMKYLMTINGGVQ